MPTALNRRILAALPLALRCLPTRFTTLLLYCRRQCSGRCWRWQAPRPRWRRRCSSAPAAAPALLSFTTSFTSSFYHSALLLSFISQLYYSALLRALLQVLFCSSCSSPNVCLDKGTLVCRTCFRAGTQFTCFTSTKVHILTSLSSPARASAQ